jgi:hypothetical protein
LCIVEHIVCLTLERVVICLKLIRKAIYREANENLKESNENNIKHEISSIIRVFLRERAKPIH